MAKVGYARTSTIEQIAGLEAQVRELQAAGCVKIFQEHASAARRLDELEKALNYVREGDEFIITKVDRISRSVSDFIKIQRLLEEKQVELNILGLGLDSKSPIGKMLITMLAGFAEMERDIMLERQKEGIAKAKAAGKFSGRKPLPQAIKDTVIKYFETNAPRTWIAEKVGIAETSVYRIIKEYRDKALS